MEGLREHVEDEIARLERWEAIGNLSDYGRGALDELRFGVRKRLPASVPGSVLTERVGRALKDHFPSEFPGVKSEQVEMVRLGWELAEEAVLAALAASVPVPESGISIVLSRDHIRALLEFASVNGPVALEEALEEAQQILGAALAQASPSPVPEEPEPGDELEGALGKAIQILDHYAEMDDGESLARSVLPDLRRVLAAGEYEMCERCSSGPCACDLEPSPAPSPVPEPEGPPSLAEIRGVAAGSLRACRAGRDDPMGSGAEDDPLTALAGITAMLDAACGDTGEGE